MKMTDVLTGRVGDVFAAYVEALKSGIDGKTLYIVQGMRYGSPLPLNLSEGDTSFAKAWKLKEQIRIQLLDEANEQMENLISERDAQSLRSSTPSTSP